MIYYLLTVVFGTLCSMATKGMNMTTAPLPGTSPEFVDYFQHPYMMTFLMFVAEFLCLPVFHLSRLFNKPDPEKEKKLRRVNPLLCAVPALCDTVGAALVYNGYNFAGASVVQMFTGVRIILTALLAWLFVGMKLYRHRIVGLIIILVGLGLISAGVMLDQHDSTSALGLLMLIIGYVFSPIQYVIEEKLFKDYDINPLECVGYEGAAGIVYAGIMLIVMQYIPCTRIYLQGEYNTYPQVAFCPYYRMEESAVGMYQIFSSGSMLLLVIVVVATLCAFNFTGQGVTKHLSSTARTTVSVIQTCVVWILCLIVQWEHFIWLQLIGFIVGTVGTILYNEIYVPSFLGLDRDTAKNIEKRREQHGDSTLLEGKK